MIVISVIDFLGDSHSCDSPTILKSRRNNKFVQDESDNNFRVIIIRGCKFLSAKIFFFI